MTACRAPKYATLAAANGWETTLEKVNPVTDTHYADLIASAPEPGHVDLSLSRTAGGWGIGLALRWYANRGQRGRLSWRLAELDGRPGNTVGFVAVRTSDGKELEGSLFGGLRALEHHLQDPTDLAAWLDELAKKDAEA